jgi:fibronectin-binding autotransporter adhesin
MAATKWSNGAADNKWSTVGNWTVNLPATTDPVTFDSTSTANCTIDALGTWSGGTLTIASTYSGTITQNTGINITTAAYSQAAGTFTCHSAATFTSTTFSVTGGEFDQGGSFVSTTFGCTSTGIYGGSSGAMSTTAVTFSGTAALKATSGNWQLAGSWTQSGATTTFTHNSGTITITAASTFNDARSSFNLINWSTSNAAITISASTTCPLGANPTTTVGTSTVTIAGIVSWAGNFTHTGNITTNNGSTLTGTSTPTLTLDRSLNIGATTTVTNAIGTVSLVGAALLTYTDTGDALSGSTFVITRTGSNAATIAANTICRVGNNPTITTSAAGLTVTGTLSGTGTLTRRTTSTGAGFTVDATGTVSGFSAFILDGGVTVTAGGTFPTVPITFLRAIVTSTVTATATTLGTCTIGGATNNAFTVAANTTCPLGASPTTTCGTGLYTSTGTTSVSGIWTHTGALSVGATGVISGAITQITLNGNLTFNAASTITAGIALSCIGSTTQTITATAYTFATSAVDKGAFPSAIIAVAANTTLPLGANPSTRGTWTSVSGTVTWTGTWTNEDDINVAAGGTISGGSAITITNGGIGFNATAVFPANLNITFSYDGAANGTNFTFAGGNQTGYGAIRRTGIGTSIVTIAGSNTFSSFRDNDGAVAHTLKFTAGTTQTVGSFTVSGSSGNRVTLQSTVGGSAWLLAPSSDFTASNVIVQDSTVVNYYGYASGNSTLVSNDTHWQLSQSASSNGVATISSGQTVSNAVDLGTVNAWDAFVGFSMPSAFTGTALTFQVSTDGSNFQDLYDSSNTQVSITVTVSKDYGFTDDVMSVLSVWRYVKLVSNAAEGAGRTIPLYIGPSRIVRAPVEAF